MLKWYRICCTTVVRGLWLVYRHTGRERKKERVKWLENAIFNLPIEKENNCVLGQRAEWKKKQRKWMSINIGRAMAQFYGRVKGMKKERESEWTKRVNRVVLTWRSKLESKKERKITLKNKRNSFDKGIKKEWHRKLDSKIER